MFKNILLFIEPNIANENMLECALGISKKFGSQISLTAVVQPIPSVIKLALQKKYAQEIFDAKRSEASEALTLANDFFNRHNLNVNSKVADGIPFVEIINQVVQQDYDLIMIMTDNNQSGVLEKFFGSTQMQLLRKCPCPVWVIKPDSGPVFKRVLTPVDTKELDEPHANLNQTLVQATRATIELGNKSINFVQVWSVYGEGYLATRAGVSEETIRELRRETLKENMQRLRDVVAQEDWGTTKVNTHFPRSDYPAEEIIQLVAKEKIDLLIMGTVCRTGIEGFIVGNTAEKVLNEVSCSVLAFKPEGFISPVVVPVKQS
ncbi:universal stress protein [Paraglaciecola sp. MB-3u-78]|jgi:universal stress protein E|uniref:universal stress protein n=1 Tax=Paraglaciecola sp. MB-3u-78 TaxID=2058332 RepID=UPI000C322138|nr:universal stress protein [Paraglaciecola sp. MB-3u-78]PKG99958.1 hypothetical protein CXF95_04695 [Paraglaciecola sp. MB-3u-78]